MNHEARPDDDDDDNRAEEVRELFKKLRREKLCPKNKTPSDPPPPRCVLFCQILVDILEFLVDIALESLFVGTVVPFWHR